jgi:hypothetical protein
MATRNRRAPKNDQPEEIQEAAPEVQAAEAQQEEAAPVVKTRNASTVESPVKRVWAIADSMPDAKRKDVIAACIEEGIAFFTARTQYQKWKQNQAT